MRSQHRILLVAALLVCAAASLDAAWIPLKAQAAQLLIKRSWNVAASGKPAPPPWPWADTHPAAVLEAPDHGVQLFVLHGSSGRNLAFGPTIANGTDTGEDLVISGHRDTHFRFLQEVHKGDRIRITRHSGVKTYEVVQTDVVDSRAARMLIDPGAKRLSLVTCYPFDAPSAGGPLRFVVTALPVPRPGS
ncbi:MAG: class GN sortase [Lysobacterales bacterium]|jgi:sortase A